MVIHCPPVPLELKHSAVVGATSNVTLLVFFVVHIVQFSYLLRQICARNELFVAYHVSSFHACSSL